MIPRRLRERKRRRKYVVELPYRNMGYEESRIVTETIARFLGVRPRDVAIVNGPVRITTIEA